MKTIVSVIGKDSVGICDDAEIEGISGGPMMGNSVSDINKPIDKRNNALTVLKVPQRKVKSTPCINCGRCAGLCPMQLYPGRVEKSLNHNKTENLLEMNVTACMECGSCAYVCPAKRPLVMSMKEAKEILRKEQSK